MSDPKHLENLVMLGLSSKQATIYLNLITEFSLTTEQLVTITGIPRTKIYSDLQDLEQKGWIYRIEGRPIKYIAISPDDIYKSRGSKIIHDMQETGHYLTTRWNEREKFKTQIVSVISGEDYLIQETLKDINGARDVIILTLRFLFANEISPILDALELQKIKGKTIKLVIYPDLFDKADHEIRNKLVVIGARIGPVPLRTLLIDNEHVLLSFLSEEKENPMVETIKINYSNFVEMMRMSFNITFETFNLAK